MLFLWLWVVSFGFWVGLPFLLEKFSISKALLTQNPKPKTKKKIINLEKETVLRDCSWTYRLSVEKCILVRKIMDKLKTVRIAKEKSSEPLPVLVYKHASIIRRKLDNTDLSLRKTKL